MDPLTLASSFLPMLMGGTKQQVSQSVSQSVSAVASPVVSVVTGGGESSPQLSGVSPVASATAASSPMLLGDTFPAFASAPLLPMPSAGFDDISQVSPAAVRAANGGLFDGLFDNPLILVGLAVGAFLLFNASGGK